MHTKADEIIYSRRKTIGLSVYPGGRLVVRAPLRTSQARIDAFVAEHTDWIAKARLKMAHVAAPPSPPRYVAGDLFWYLGQQYPLQISASARAGLSFSPEHGFVLAQARQAEAARLFIQFYKLKARELTMQLVGRYTQQTGFTVGKVRITSAKTRWGSCSGKNNLNFSYRLVMAPYACVEYVVVHELAHTQVHNHSRDYWALVGQIMPDYKQRRAWLKEHAARLAQL